MKTDSRIDEYISNSAEFARDILIELRSIVHDFCPDAEETVKWGMPMFVYKKSILCNLASFKNHCSFGFWRNDELTDKDGILKRNSEGGMGSLGKLTELSQLPQRDQLGQLLIQAMELVDSGVKPIKTKPLKILIPEIPFDLAEALAENETAKITFEKLAPSHKKEYILWITSAKKEETRLRRLEKTIETLEKGQSKEEKYKR